MPAGLDYTERISALVFPNMLETRVLDLKEQWCLHATCRAFLPARVHAEAVYGEYVAELRSGALSGMTWAPTTRGDLARFSRSRAFYYVDMLLRGFMQYVLRAPQSTVLAGSVGAAILLNKLGIARPWFPNDIDFYVTEEKRTELIVDAYITGVLCPLGCLWDTRTKLFYDDSSDDDEDEMFDAAGVPDDIRSEAATADAYEELRGVIRRPSAGRPAAGYNVLQSTVTEPLFPAAFPDDLRRLIRPVNVILIQVPAASGPTVGLAARVRNGFDLVPCAVNVSVAGAFSYHCSCTRRASAAARLRLLFFSPEAVVCRHYADIPRMVHRVRKYGSRGFTFMRSFDAVSALLAAEEMRDGDVVVEY